MPRTKALLVAWGLLLAAGGAGLGAWLALRSETTPSFSRVVPPFLQAPDARLPVVSLRGEGPASWDTSTVLGPAGTVVLFLDTACDPCRIAAARWQAHRDEGSLGAVEVLGITLSSRPEIERFREELALDFPLYEDATRTFLERYGVDSFPWELVVDAHGAVVAYTGWPTEMGDLAALRSLE